MEKEFQQRSGAAEEEDIREKGGKRLERKDQGSNKEVKRKTMARTFPQDIN